MDATTAPAPTPQAMPPAHRDRLRLTAALTSLLVVALGIGWCLGDTLWYFSPGDDRADTSLLSLVPQPVVAGLAVGLGLLGALTALRGRDRPLVAVAAVQVVAFLVLAGDGGVLILMGYLTALVFPLVLVACLLWGAARHRAARIGLGVLAVLGTTAVLTSDLFDGQRLADLGEGLAGGLERHLPPHLVVALFIGHGALWALVGLRARRAERGACTSCGRPGGGRLLVRWAVPVTVLAAACGLPYFLVRLTWLTGSPVGVDAAELETSPGIQVMGFMLGLMGLVAATLTIGLLLPWGRVFPRWIPVVGGRDVPVLFPTLAAGLVGAVMAVAGRAMVQSLIHDRANGEDVQALYLVLIPLPVWGPALMLAAGAYYLRFRGRCEVCGVDEPAPATAEALRAAR